MKTGLVISATVFLLFFLFGCLLPSVQPSVSPAVSPGIIASPTPIASIPPTSSEMQACSADFECVIVDESACRCNEGGKLTSINSRYEEYWNAQLDVTRQSLVICPQVYLCRDEQPQARCVKNSCEAVYASEPVVSATPVPEGYQSTEGRRLGLVNAGAIQQNRTLDFSLALESGARWDSQHVGPFNWETVGFKNFDFSAADAVVGLEGDNNFHLLATVWPFNSADQNSCHPLPSQCASQQYGGLAQKRCKPCNIDAFKDFLRATVRRYSNESAEYRVLYWQIGYEPAKQDGLSFFKGTPADYVELLKASSEVIRSECRSCKVLFAGLSNIDEENSKFFREAHALGAANHYDIAAVHSLNKDAGGNVKKMKELLSSVGYPDKKLWLTQVSFSSGNYGLNASGRFISDAEHAELMVRGLVTAFADGAQKIFYVPFRADSFMSEEVRKGALLELEDEKRPAFSAFSALSRKIGDFQSVERLNDTQFLFTKQDGSKIYVLWGKKGDLPPVDVLAADKLLITDVFGFEAETGARIPLDEWNLNDSPFYVEVLN